MDRPYVVKQHESFLTRNQTEDPGFNAFLTARRNELARLIQTTSSDASTDWQTRTFPVIGILAPVMTTHEDKIEFPGDPMCLYSALSYSVDQVVKAKELGIGPESPYNDLCPQMGILPSREYRASVPSHGIRDYSRGPLNTDQIIFDPRVWNAEVKRFFIENVLQTVRPNVVLISTVSPGFRYAIDIAATVKDHLPDTLVIIGGRHIDETTIYNYMSRELIQAHSGVLACLNDGRIKPVFDFGIGGEGYFALDALLKAISISLPVDSKTLASKTDIFNNLDKISLKTGELPGRALIFGVQEEDQQFHIWPINGKKFDLGKLPSPYKSFAIRAQFPIFENEDRSVCRTAHMMVSNSCPYHCYYCSEGMSAVKPALRFEFEATSKAVERVLEFVGYGAEAIFFDDSIFWSGNTRRIEDFCQKLRTLKNQVASGDLVPENYTGTDMERLINLKWGAQFTVDLLASVMEEEEALKLLDSMKQAGCTYLYLGIESMSESVIKHIHKYTNSRTAWKNRVRKALQIVKRAGLHVGSSILFGLEHETKETIGETIAEVELLIQDELLHIASPNILTYHPNTAITQQHGMHDKVDYHSVVIENRPPYTYFEEAFPSVVSINLTEEDIWYIHDQTLKRWGIIRNSNAMAPSPIVEAAAQTLV
jgi:radical SAM superfamily enzyme YgiQ (UPF0313 family)